MNDKFVLNRCNNCSTLFICNPEHRACYCHSIGRCICKSCYRDIEKEYGIVPCWDLVDLLSKKEKDMLLAALMI